MSKSRNMSGIPTIGWGIAVGLIVSISSQSACGQKTDFDRQALQIHDSVVLKSGSKLNGTWQSESIGDDKRNYLLFQALDGPLLKLDIAKSVERGQIHRLDDADREYNSLLMNMSDEPNAHWTLYEWLDNQPKSVARFPDQLRFHLERIVELDPNDVKAKRKLGMRLIDSQDRWVPELQYFNSIGFEKSGTSWAPIRQAEVSRQHQTILAINGERKSSFSLWLKKWRKSPNARYLQAELYQFCDAPAVPYIYDEWINEDDPRKRSMYIYAIGRVPSRVAQNALCEISINDTVIANRENAMVQLAQEHYSKAGTVAYLSRFLPSPGRSSTPPRSQILRAAFAIGEMGDESAVLKLTPALITTHQVQAGDQPGRTKVGTDNTGTFNFGGDTAPVNRSFQNDDVVAALRKLTNEDFGFDELAWKRWYIENHTHHDIQLRR
ncbi:MAG: hypothetical protein ACI87E_005297 [Mariniblastus sp.]|jgi:hypothetical protein